MKYTTTISTINQTDIGLIVEFGKSYYPPDSHVQSPKYLEWLYLDNPSGNAELVSVRSSEGLVAMMALIPATFRMHTATKRGFFAVHVLTHPRYQGSGFFSRMIDFAKTDLRKRCMWFLGHPNQNALAGWIKHKMTFRQPLQLYFLPFRKSKIVTIVEVTKESQIDDISQGFWADIVEGQSENRCKIYYTPEFLKWRYWHSPYTKYRIFLVFGDDGLIGFKVTKRVKSIINLLVDFASTSKEMKSVLSGVPYPTIVACPNVALFTDATLFNLPINKKVPFFLNTWGEEAGVELNTDEITLGVSDF